MNFFSECQWPSEGLLGPSSALCLQTALPWQSSRRAAVGTSGVAAVRPHISVDFGHTRPKTMGYRGEKNRTRTSGPGPFVTSLEIVAVSSSDLVQTMFVTSKSLSSSGFRTRTVLETRRTMSSRRQPRTVTFEIHGVRPHGVGSGCSVVRSSGLCMGSLVQRVRRCPGGSPARHQVQECFVGLTCSSKCRSK